MSEKGWILRPCPFCGGPPVLFLQKDVVHGAWYDFANEEGGGDAVNCFVFCHECGAQGPHFNDCSAFEAEDIHKIQNQAAEEWNTSGFHHLEMFKPRRQLPWPKDWEEAPYGGA